MRALEAWRVVAAPAAIDRVRWVPLGDGAVTLIRIAPDEILAVDAAEPVVDDPYAIVERETGFVGSWDWTLEDLRAHADWSLPSERPASAQGAIAGVPAKVRIEADGRVLVVTAAGYAPVLSERLGPGR